MLTFFTMTWSLWMLRNSAVFEQQPLHTDAVIGTIKWRIALWSKAWSEEVPYSAQELARNFTNLANLFP